MGFVVDRFGPKRVLIAGLVLGGLAFVLLGLRPSYQMLLATAVLAGLANCVYHPADYAILSASIGEGKGESSRHPMPQQPQTASDLRKTLFARL